MPTPTTRQSAQPLEHQLVATRKNPAPRANHVLGLVPTDATTLGAVNGGNSHTCIYRASMPKQTVEYHPVVLS